LEDSIDEGENNSEEIKDVPEVLEVTDEINEDLSDLI